MSNSQCKIMPFGQLSFYDFCVDCNCNGYHKGNQWRYSSYKNCGWFRIDEQWVFQTFSKVLTDQQNTSWGYTWKEGADYTTINGCAACDICCVEGVPVYGQKPVRLKTNYAERQRWGAWYPTNIKRTVNLVRKNNAFDYDDDDEWEVDYEEATCVDGMNVHRLKSSFEP